MVDRSVAAFVLSLLGATYQLVSFSLAYLVDHQFTLFYFGLYNYQNLFAPLIVFWAIAHLMDKQDSRRTTWPAIILAIGVTNLVNLIIGWISPIGNGLTAQSFPLDLGLTLLPAPLLLILGGIFGFIAARRVGRAAAVISSLNRPQ